MPIFKMTIGFVLLFAGCHISWFFVGAAGLLLGDYIGSELLHLTQTWNLFSNDIKYGILASLIAFLHKRITTIIGGGLHCAFLVYNLPIFFGANMDWFSWLYFVIAFIIGVALIYFFDVFSIIVISSLSGAILVTQNSNLGTISPLFTLITLLFLGVATQFILLRYNYPSRDESTS